MKAEPPMARFPGPPSGCLPTTSREWVSKSWSSLLIQQLAAVGLLLVGLLWAAGGQVRDSTPRREIALSPLYLGGPNDAARQEDKHASNDAASAWQQAISHGNEGWAQGGFTVRGMTVISGQASSQVPKGNVPAVSPFHLGANWANWDAEGFSFLYLTQPNREMKPLSLPLSVFSPKPDVKTT